VATVQSSHRVVAPVPVEQEFDCLLIVVSIAKAGVGQRHCNRIAALALPAVESFARKTKDWFAAIRKRRRERHNIS
jgi:hypothetical protein